MKKKEQTMKVKPLEKQYKSISGSAKVHGRLLFFVCADAAAVDFLFWFWFS